MIEIFTITGLYYGNYDITKDRITSDNNVRSRRCFGFYNKLSDAISAVANNYGDMEEGLFNFLVIESLPEGIFRTPTDSIWYEWSDEHGWKYLDVSPKWSDGIVNYAL